MLSLFAVTPGQSRCKGWAGVIASLCLARYESQLVSFAFGQAQAGLQMSQVSGPAPS
jgi:hypothetical protein